MRFLRLTSTLLLVTSVAFIGFFLWIRTWSWSAASEAAALIEVPFWILVITVPLCLLGSLIAGVLKKQGAGRCVLISAIACVILSVFFVI